MKKLVLATSFALSLFLSSCSSDDDNDFGIAKNKEYPVSLTVDLKSDTDGHLIFGDISKVVIEPRVETDQLGYKGLILYSDKKNNLTVFDLACPNCWNGNILVKRNRPTNEYDCPVCGLNGSVSNGKGYFWNDKGSITKVMDLVQYEVSKQGTSLYIVSNPK